ncbi:MAG TPA: alpha/beta fold hydrolase [Burkholderiaceae bacterium]|nr:alpha/beta fold hydrolase [Burkholderiaceae bacterium]
MSRILFAALLLSLALGPALAAAGPCSTATPACTEMFAPATGPGRTLIYRTYPLDAKNPAITRALIVIHGLSRDADNYFRHALAAAFLAGALDDTLIVVPRFASNQGGACKDELAPGELSWHCQPRSDAWRNGGTAVDGTVTTFDVVDELLRRLTRKDVFPQLKAIVVAGHSAGGQFVSRYEMTNLVHESLPIKPTYVVANPSSYTYFDNLRPTASALPANVAAGAPGYTAPVEKRAAFVTFADANNCTSFDHWPYGLKERTGYSTRLDDEQIRKQLADRPTTYMLGELDILPLYGFDSSCPAMAQGPTRLARGLAYVRYVDELFGAKHKAIVISACGHNARCLFTADSALPLLFPN